MPFVSSCDSTRANMSAKQFSQSLTHLNCEVPYVLGNEWHELSKTSALGVSFAEDDGEIIYNKNDILIEHYPKINKINVDRIPPMMKTSSIFGSQLRDSLKKGTKFQKGDILYEYDAFKNSIPSSGYNVWTAYCPFFGFNHEDALVVSEGFANRAKHSYTETVYVPIYEYTLLQKIYKNKLGYFPEIGEEVHNDTLCISLLPQSARSKKEFDTNSIKNQVLNTLQTLNLSDLINMRITGQAAGFTCDNVKIGIGGGKITGFKIHRLKREIQLVDKELQKSIDKIYNAYNLYVLDVYSDLTKLINDQFAKKVIRQYYLYGDRDRIRKNLNLKDAVYLLEFEISKENHACIGDKMSKKNSTHQK